MWKKIANQMQRLLTYNTGLKCLSVVAAVLLWLLVVNLDDPTQSRNFTATVSLINESKLTQQGKYYELPDGNTVTFRVTARRSVIEDLSSGDFLAVADFERLEDDVRIPIEITVKRHANAVRLSSKTHYLTVKVEELSETTFVIQPTASGKVAEGFAVGDMTVSPDIVTVQGPADLVSTIDSAKVKVDVSGQMEDFNASLVPKYYNKTGQEIDTTALKLSTESVEVAVDMQSVQEVKLLVETSGELAKDLELGSITTDPQSIKLRGQPDLINSISTITIPADVINLSELKGDFETTVDILSYIPKGLSLADNTSSQVTIKVEVLSESSKSFTVNTSNLTLRNIGPGLTGIFEEPSVEVKISGLESALKELDEKTLAGYVDVSGLTEGIHSVSVMLELDEGLSASKATTDVDIRRLSDTEDGDTKKEPSGIPEKKESEASSVKKQSDAAGGSDSQTQDTTGDAAASAQEQTTSGQEQATSGQEQTTSGQEQATSGQKKTTSGQEQASEKGE